MGMYISSRPERPDRFALEIIDSRFQAEHMFVYALQDTISLIYTHTNICWLDSDLSFLKH